jgi:5-methyltetrahydrofolate--homocysteine methyltransferase
MSARDARIAALRAAATQRILLLDGAWGSALQERDLDAGHYACPGHGHDLRGDFDVLALSSPAEISALHDAYFAAGADIASTNTFNATAIAQADYGMQDRVREINLAAARLARDAADAWTRRDPARPRWVAGVLGPTNRTLSLSRDVSDPGARDTSWAELYAAYREQALALHEGDVDLLMLETVFDTLNARRR